MKDETLLTDEQAAFEKFMEENFRDLIDRSHVKNGDGGYFAWDMVVAWIVWQGRAALQSGNSGQVPDEKLPMNYLQGQKDGLEWAAQMAEASHPNTGDWLYDDPVELAKAIRKGPDMPKNDNTLVIPDGLIAAVNRLLDSDGSRGCFSAIKCYDAHEEVERLLAAVKGE